MTDDDRIRPEDAPRVSPSEARRLVEEEDALLVCAYDNEDKCDEIALPGSMPFPRLEDKQESLSRDRHLVFY